jgi:hypothetical protein
MSGPTAAGRGSTGADGTDVPDAATDLPEIGVPDVEVPDVDVSDKVAMLEAELAGLRRALHNRAVIEQAMGILAVLRRCTPEDAFQLLVRLSQVSNVKLHRIAQLLVQLTNGGDPVTLEGALATALRQDGPPPAPPVAGPPQVDEALIAAARHVVETASNAVPHPGGDSLDQAIRDLYLLLINRGWIAPYDVLADM